MKQRLDALTSLRFFAALMIVVHHLVGYDLFGLGTSIGIQRAAVLNTGVSFFFVLSGFILTYVYPDLKAWVDVKHFLWARISRIWPGYLASFLFAFWLLSFSWEYKTGITNLLMLQAWIPYMSYFFSYNSPAWSISTEFFFYLAFPFLIYKWDKTWGIKLLLSCAIVLSVILAVKFLNIPYSGSPHQEDDVINATGLLYVHPITRVFEFIFGIFVAKLFLKRSSFTYWSESRATFYECTSILLVCMFMLVVHPAAMWAKSTWMGPGLALWIGHSGSMFAFGLLIYVIGMERGRLSAWLSYSPLILLGEISFAIYLLHASLIRYYKVNIEYFPDLPGLFELAFFLMILLLSSYLMWALIEMPCRRFMLRLGGQAKIHGTKAMRQTWQHHLNWNKRTLLASSVLLGLLGVIYFSMGNIQYITTFEADHMTPVSLKSFAGTTFGERFKLRGLKITHAADGVHMTFAWESLVKQKLTYTNGVQVKDINNNVVAWGDYKQPMSRLPVEKGTIWKDSIFIPKEKFTGVGTHFLLGLYHQPPRRVLSVDNSANVNGRWLNIPL